MPASAAAAVAPDRLPSLASLLGSAETCVGGLSSPYRGALARLRERLDEERLQVAVLGQFKRGKSTFLNALLGAPVLPTGVVPLTAIATFLRWAAAPSIRVSYLDGRPAAGLRAADIDQLREQLARLVTEEANPRNRLKVARVELFYPAPILRPGIVLIDTPGVGSTLRHNTEAAIAVLPECDVGFFVLSADPPVTEAELLYLDRVRPHVARLFFVLNKIDYLAPRERLTALDFLRRNLAEHMPGAADPPILCLSARQALAARQRGDAEGLRQSGLADIEHRLAGFLAREKLGSLQQAVAAKAGALVDAAGMDVALGIRVLELPLADLERRAGQFAEAVRGIERQRLVARDLLAGDRRRALETLEEQAAGLRRQAREVLHAVLDRALDGRPERPEDAAKTAIAAAIPEFFEPKLAAMSGHFAAAVERVLSDRVGRAETLIGRVRETAAALFEIPSAPFEGAASFAIRREPYWVADRWNDGVNPFGGGLDRLLPAARRMARLRRRLAAEIDELVERNVENLRWATLQNLDSAFHRFAGWFDARLAETIALTCGAIEAAATRRHEHAAEVREELARLRRAAGRLHEVRDELTQYGRQMPVMSLPLPG